MLYALCFYPLSIKAWCLWEKSITAQYRSNELHVKCGPKMYFLIFYRSVVTDLPSLALSTGALKNTFASIFCRQFGGYLRTFPSVRSHGLSLSIHPPTLHVYTRGYAYHSCGLERPGGRCGALSLLGSRWMDWVDGVGMAEGRQQAWTWGLTMWRTHACRPYLLCKS